MNKIIEELKSQMEDAAFISAVEEQVDGMELFIFMLAKAKDIYPHKLCLILSLIIGRMLISSCPDNLRQVYAGAIKTIIDRSVEIASEE